MSINTSSSSSVNSSSANFKIICSQNDMKLSKSPEMKLFTLEYNYTNPHFDIISLINVNIHKLLYEVNKDIIDTIIIEPNPDDTSEYNILYKFKEIGGELSANKTYMYVSTKIAKRYASNGNTEIVFTSKSIPYEFHNELIFHKYKLLEYPLYIQKFIYQEHSSSGKSTIQVLHMFKLKPDNESELTVTMENAIGILIKKMYLRLKNAIECLRS